MGRGLHRPGRWSDDGFEYFRGWLISQGRGAHALAVSDPGALGLAIDPDSAEEEREWEDLFDGLAMPKTAHPLARRWRCWGFQRAIKDLRQAP